MKFTDGFWLMKKGINIKYPREVYRVVKDEERVIITAPARNIKKRGNTLTNMLFTITFSSPLRGVLRVQIEHFQGKKSWT